MALKGTSWWLKDSMRLRNDLHFGEAYRKDENNQYVAFFTLGGTEQYKHIGLMFDPEVEAPVAIYYTTMSGDTITVYDETRSTNKWTDQKYRDIRFIAEPTYGGEYLEEFLRAKEYRELDVDDDYTVNASELLFVADAIRDRKINGHNMIRTGRFQQGKGVFYGIASVNSDQKHWATTVPMLIHNGQDYVFSFTGTGTTYIYLLYVSEDDETQYNTITGSGNSVSFRPTNPGMQGAIKEVYCMIQVITASDNVVISNAQLEKGTVAHAYAPRIDLAFPNDFISAIGTLTDTSDADATASDIMSGKTAYVNGTKITGNNTGTLTRTDTTVTVDTLAAGTSISAYGMKYLGITMLTGSSIDAYIPKAATIPTADSGWQAEVVYTLSGNILNTWVYNTANQAITFTNGATVTFNYDACEIS